MNQAIKPDVYPAAKDLKKLTIEQFRRLVKTLPEIRSQHREFAELVRSSPRAMIKEVLDKDFHWSSIYQHSFVQNITLLVYAVRKVDELHRIAGSEDPPEALLNWTLGDDEEFEEWRDVNGFEFKRKHLVGLVAALQRNILSIMLFHRPVCDLIREFQEGNLNSMFLAIRVDRSVVSCPPVADRIALAELENDSRFFLHLRAALKGPSKKLWECFKDLRYALAVMREIGMDSLSDAQMEDLLVKKLKLYPDVPSARKNLRKQFNLSKKIATPSK